jgi:hypothetical protein
MHLRLSGLRATSDQREHDEAGVELLLEPDTSQTHGSARGVRLFQYHHSISVVS